MTTGPSSLECDVGAPAKQVLQRAPVASRGDRHRRQPEHQVRPQVTVSADAERVPEFVSDESDVAVLVDRAATVDTNQHRDMS